MIVPITVVKHGEDQTIGTASVSPEGEVDYYLKPGYSMAQQVMDEMTKQLRRLASR
jgi:hypothetical protein